MISRGNWKQSLWRISYYNQELIVPCSEVKKKYDLVIVLKDLSWCETLTCLVTFLNLIFFQPSLNPEYEREPNQNKSLAAGVWGK